MLHAPVEMSLVATGAPITVGVIVDEPVLPAESVAEYCTAVAAPVNGPVQLMPVGVEGAPFAEHGVNVTVPLAFAAYTPCPGTITCVPVHGRLTPAAHNFTGVPDEGQVAAVEAESSTRGLIVCATPCAPDETLARATGLTTYWPFTTPAVPTARTAVPDVEVPDTALLDEVSEPVSPEAV